jgi:hypothetical protein
MFQPQRNRQDRGTEGCTVQVQTLVFISINNNYFSSRPKGMHSAKARNGKLFDKS